jgi:hypothetical protein
LIETRCASGRTWIYGSSRSSSRPIRSYAPDLFYGPRGGEPLFHYTDLAGLLGIVTNNDLWLTHSLYSNDAEELRHGRSVAREVLKKEIELAQVDPEKLGYLKMVDDLVSEQSRDGVYIC